MFNVKASEVDSRILKQRKKKRQTQIFLPDFSHSYDTADGI